MPKSLTIDGGHGVLTDHGISIRRNPKQTAIGPDLAAFLGESDDRSLGLAYAELGDGRARAHLLRAKPFDAEVRFRLAALEPDAGRARALYESVLRDLPTQPVALVNLGSLYAQTGRTADAEKLWQRALEANAGTEAAVLNLARIKPPKEARAIIKRYLEFNPGSKTAVALLATLQ